MGELVRVSSAAKRAPESVDVTALFNLKCEFEDSPFKLEPVIASGK